MLKNTHLKTYNSKTEEKMSNNRKVFKQIIELLGILSGC